MGKIDLKGKLKTQEEYMADLYGDNASGLKEIAISDLRPYKNQPFKPYPQEKLYELAEDIKQNGVMSPIIVRKMKADDDNPYDYYQILAGHNRVKASELAGLEKIPSIVKLDITDEEAQLILVNTNLNQREELLPSEKAFAYKMQMEAIKQQGKRTDLTSGTMCQKLNASEKIGSDNFDSARNVRNYIRLTYLIGDLLNMVDEKELPFRSGVALSYLTKDEQEVCYEYMDAHKISFSVEESENIKRYKQEFEGAVINEAVLDKLFAKPIKEKKEKPIKISISTDYVNKYFSGKSPKEIEKELVHILDDYFKQYV